MQRAHHPLGGLRLGEDEWSSRLQMLRLDQNNTNTSVSTTYPR